MIAKRDLSKKTCPACGLEISWRKKLASDWPHVRYCSDACRKGASRIPLMVGNVIAEAKR